uniref:Uncharacterized protein n=1 Tax=Arundo donax TaxID=35708 RepID=A0A0A9H4J7_ARUDO
MQRLISLQDCRLQSSILSEPAEDRDELIGVRGEGIVDALRTRSQAASPLPSSSWALKPAQKS